MNRDKGSEKEPSRKAAPTATKRTLGKPIVFVTDSGKSVTLVSDRTGREITLCSERQPGPG